MRRQHLLRLRVDDYPNAMVLTFDDCTDDSCELDHVLVETYADRTRSEVKHESWYGDSDESTTN